MVDLFFGISIKAPSLTVFESNYGFELFRVFLHIPIPWLKFKILFLENVLTKSCFLIEFVRFLRIFSLKQKFK